MKLCITSTGKDIEAKVDPRFGRATYFLIIDTDSGVLEVVENTAAAGGQGAGIGAAQIVSDKGADRVLTGRVGPNALKAFQESGIKLFEGVSAQETVKEALARFKKGEYSHTAAPSDVPPRGQGVGRGQGRGRGGGRCRQG